MSCNWTIINTIFTICKKNCSKIHLYEKVIFGHKDMKSFSKATPLAHLILFTPIKDLQVKELVMWGCQDQ
jgi:hypothetical protein